MLATMLVSSLEDAILRSGPNNTAQNSNGIAAIAASGINTWGKAASILKMLAFDPGATGVANDCWAFLGLSALHGPTPSLPIIHHRFKLGDDIARAGEQPDWAADDASLAKAFRQNLEEATQLCLKRLPEALQHRKMLKASSAIPRWLEPDPDFTVWLAQDAALDQGKTIVAVNLSNLHGLDLAPFAPIVLSPNECLPIYKALYGSPSEIQSCIQNFHGKDVVLWAPDNGRALGQVLNVMDRMHKEDTCKFNLHFLVPFTPMPNCVDAEAIGELWSHQMLAPKFTHLRKGVEYFLDPVRCVFSGNTAPLHHLKNIAIITMRTAGNPRPPCIRTFKTTVATHAIGKAIRVDVPEECQRGVYVYLQNLQLVHCLGWEYGQKSPGSIQSAKRSFLTGFFDAGKVSNLELTGIVKFLRNLPELRLAFVGSEQLFGNPNALILDFADTRTIYEVRDMLEEIVFVSPSRAVIDTQNTSREWENIMTHMYHQDPRSALKGLRFRVGLFGGKTFARPGVLAAYAANDRARLKLDRAPQEIRDRELLNTQLHISGLPQTQKGEVMQKIITHITDVVGIRLCPRTGDSLAHGEWEVGEDSKEGGQIHVLLRSPEDHIKLLSHVHGAGLSINGHHLSIEVRSIQAAQFAGRLCKNFVQASGSSTGVASSGGTGVAGSSS